MENCTPIRECLACGGTDLVPTLNLGEQPLANNFKTIDAIEERYPLAVNRCKHCDHLQLTHAVDPKLIYTHYLYVSGTSKTYVEYMDWYAQFVREQFTYWPTTVLDVGCNDEYGVCKDTYIRNRFDDLINRLIINYIEVYNNDGFIIYKKNETNTK